MCSYIIFVTILTLPMVLILKEKKRKAIGYLFRIMGFIYHICIIKNSLCCKISSENEQWIGGYLRREILLFD